MRGKFSSSAEWRIRNLISHINHILYIYVYIYIYIVYIHISLWMEETWGFVSVHWQQGKFQLWANIHESEPSSERGPQNLKRHLPPTVMSNVLTIRSCLARQHWLAPAERYYSLNSFTNPDCPSLNCTPFQMFLETLQWHHRSAMAPQITDNYTVYATYCLW